MEKFKFYLKNTRGLADRTIRDYISGCNRVSRIVNKNIYEMSYQDFMIVHDQFMKGIGDLYVPRNASNGVPLSAMNNLKTFLQTKKVSNNTDPIAPMFPTKVVEKPKVIVEPKVEEPKVEEAYAGFTEYSDETTDLLSGNIFFEDNELELLAINSAKLELVLIGDINESAKKWDDIMYFYDVKDIIEYLYERAVDLNPWFPHATLLPRRDLDKVNDARNARCHRIDKHNNKKLALRTGIDYSKRLIENLKLYGDEI